MSFKGHEKYNLIEKIDLPDLKAIGYRLEHKKTKAKVALIDCDDNNKVFMIGFRTPPADDTGLPHIMEHSVLCGSKNFPVKDPFVELAKGSLNTFLNAMTYPDKTVYPVASVNDKDFQNLLHIYLDAVFYPNIYKHEEIFRQEGWNYNLTSKDDKLTYNGVVYNEMKGAFSSPDGIMERESFNATFPHNCYAKESGGCPDSIPDLTYEQFIGFHKKYYHPSNSYIYLYGDMDFDEKLEFIDKEYLGDFDYKEIDSEIMLEKDVKDMIKVFKDYPVTEKSENTTYYSYNKVAGTSLDKRKNIAFDAINYALVESPGSPIEVALTKAGIGEDISGHFETDLYQPFFSITAKNAPEGKEEEFAEIIEKTLKDTAENGINKKALEAGLLADEFYIRQGDFGRYPKGLMYGLRNFSSWLYDDNEPFMYSDLLEDYKWLKEQINTGYFENLIKEYLIDNKHGSIVCLNPKEGLESQRTKELEEKLENKKKSLSEKELEELVENTIHLKQYQEKPETKEDMDKIPVLKRSDINPKEQKALMTVQKEENITYLIHENDTNGIDIVTINFNANHISSDRWLKYGVMVNAIEMVDTQNYTYNDLYSEIYLKTGGISVESLSTETLDGGDKTFLSISGKCLKKNIDDMINLFEEILTKSKFDDVKRIDELLGQLSSKIQATFLSSGHSSAFRRAIAHFRPMYALKENIDGIEMYKNIDSIRKELKEEPEKVVKELTELLKDALNTDDVIVSLAGSKAQIEVEKRKVKELIDKVSEFNNKVKTKPYMENATIRKKKEAFKTASKIQYVARCGFFDISKRPYVGALNVLKTILSYEYLWNNIRVMGGAYGCMSACTRKGDGYLVTYRDPHLKRSNEVFEKLPEYLRNLELSDESLTKFVVGTMSSYDAPLTASMQITKDNNMYLCGMKEEMRQKTRDEILNITIEDIRKLADYMQEIIDCEEMCVIGGEDKIEEHKDMFDEIYTLN